MSKSTAPSAQQIRDEVWPQGKIVGDSGRVSRAARALDALEPGCLGFMSRPPKSDIAADRFAGSTLLCGADTVDALEHLIDVTTIVVKNPRLAFMRAVGSFFQAARPEPGVHSTSVIDDTAAIDPTATVGPFCTIGPRCSVGPRCVLAAGVTLVADVKLGEGVTIAGGTVIGADGFGYERNEHGELEKFPHVGGVVIAEHVEIGSNTSIDRGTLDATRIGARARIDNQVHVAHNVVVGADAAIIAQAMIGGSVKIGERAWIAPSATIMNQVSIGSDATVGLGAVVVKDVPDGATVMGSPAQEDTEFRRTRAALKRLMADG